MEQREPSETEGKGQDGGEKSEIDEVVKDVVQDVVGENGEEQQGQPHDPSTITTTRLYVGNLSWDTTWQSLKDHMREAGNVLYTKIFEDEYGRSKGCGIVEYNSVDEARAAYVQLNDTMLDGRLIFVREDREDRHFGSGRGRGGFRGRGRGRGGRGRGRGRGYGGYNSSQGPPGEASSGKQLFISNLSWNTSWQNLKDHFAQAERKVIRADVVYGPQGRSKGFGTVLFETEEDATHALNMLDQSELDGRVISVRLDRYA